MNSDYTAGHFRSLRLAKLRGLTIRPTSDGGYVVSSHSRAGHFYHVRPGEPCPCEARGECTHKALVCDAVALEGDYIRYSAAQALDFYRLRKSQLEGVKLQRTDRQYQRHARALAERKMAERARDYITEEVF